MERLRILILGAAGMLGHVVSNYFQSRPGVDVFETIRNPNPYQTNLVYCDAERFETVAQCIAAVHPEVVINCIGIIKQLPAALDTVRTITVNALFPHRLAQVCLETGARFIHISTDCVFDGSQGNYRETDSPCPQDLYGRTKLLGEVSYPPGLTLRTSIIGHELHSQVGLAEWFLSQSGSVQGYTHAIYTGLPTIVLARVIDEYVLPHPELLGLYHVSADPISKYDLLQLLAEVYRKDIPIIPVDEPRIDRSLNSERFRTLTGYSPPPWSALIRAMYDHYRSANYYT